ncbi:MAG TPA: PIN domain-containing protein [Chthoniobacterales bacterium]|nr:PIN domain-containing protein [Chthoniobacterales bacterium]
MRLLLDTDVLLDVAMAREPFGPDSRSVLHWCHDSPHSAVLAWHTVANLYYLIAGARNDGVARQFISGLLDFSEIASTGKAAVRHALTLRMRDFEDALQVAAALSADVQFIVTRNLSDYRGSPLPAITPREFIKRFLKT